MIAKALALVVPQQNLPAPTTNISQMEFTHCNTTTTTPLQISLLDALLLVDRHGALPFTVA